MARIRTVKPEFWRHPVLGRLPDDFQLLALSLLTMADDEGYFRAEPALIRGDVQPFRDDLGNISRGLRELLRVGWIEVGKHPEQGEIGFIVNFSKHQRVHNPTPSKLKTYFLGNISRVSPEDFPLEQGTGNREHDLFSSPSVQSNEPLNGNGKVLHHPKKKTACPDSRHAPFREKLEKFWAHLNPDGPTFSWGPGDAKQLSDLLHRWNDLTIETFHSWLLNYSESEDVIDGKTPKQFLPIIHEYKDGPHDKFHRVKDQHAQA